MADGMQVSTAAESRRVAIQLAKAMVEARLAASAQIVGPIASVFWHSGELGQAEEWQVVFKTTAERYLELESRLLACHPWNNPEITAVPIVAAHVDYLDWLHRTTAQDRPSA